MEPAAAFDHHWVVCLDIGERHTVTPLNNGAIDSDRRKYSAKILEAPLDLMSLWTILGDVAQFVNFGGYGSSIRTLQRFPITKDFSREPLHPDGDMAQLEETAALDLKYSGPDAGLG